MRLRPVLMSVTVAFVLTAAASTRAVSGTNEIVTAAGRANVAPARAADGAMTIALDVAAIDRVAPGENVTIAGIPLAPDETVALDLRRFTVTGSETQFVIGDDRVLDFDPARVRLLRGAVHGRPGTHAFLAVSDHGSIGWIDAGTGAGSGAGAYVISGRGGGGRITIAPVSGAVAASGGLPVPRCGVVPPPAEMLAEMRAAVRRAATATESMPMVREGASPGAGVVVRGRRQIELAVETDYEFFAQLGSTDAAAAYVVALYGAVSDVYQRDLNTQIDLAFVRLWDTPDDLFNGDDPLVEFRDYWNDNMGDVDRDVAQFFSGRRDLPWGGIAWLRSVCTDNGYSVCAYALGSFADPDVPNVFNRDLSVAAHELGHSAGTSHTHDLGVDTCDDETSTPQRGTIMSYCDQTFTGGTANADMRFHTVVQEVILDWLDRIECVVFDCNQNGVADDLDIGAGTSSDVNGNGIPDECEDCNGNGALDSQDVVDGTSSDENTNGIPDECEPDCNENMIPDDLDIALGTSTDLYGNGVPDECEADCGGAAGSDYNEIQADMSLDLDRNAVLDECEDCDGDGITDLAALDHANDIWIAGLDLTSIRSYLARVGTLVGVSEDAAIMEAQDLLVSNDRRVFVSSKLDHRVLEFDVDGAYLGDFVPPMTGGLFEPAAMAFRPDGNLLVVSRQSDSVLEYDRATGAFVREFVQPGSGGLVAPFGLAFGPGSHLYVTSDDNRVLEYNASGSFLGVFTDAAENGGLSEPRGMLFLPGSGNLLVASHGTDQVLEYDGSTGAFVRQFNQGGTVDRLTLDQPWTLRLGPEGHVYVSRAHDHEEEAIRDDRAQLHLTNARVYEFLPDSGFLVRAYILGVDSGILHPTGFDFVPSGGLDCNLNVRPDVCDILQRSSADGNGNGVPDECDACPLDIDGSGSADFGDVLAVLAGWGPCPAEPPCVGDFDASATIDFADVLEILREWGPCPSN